MKITFDFAIDGRAWPGPLGGADFACGDAWVGPLGLLDLLETRLALGGRFEGPLERTCRLAVSLRGRSGYWRQSFERAPLPTCRRLLRDRDELRLWGWTGQPVSGRLAELHEATSDASPGMPERLKAVALSLAVRSPGIESVVSHTVIAHLPPLWRAVFSALKNKGVAVEQRALAPARALGDLAAARGPGFEPAGDGRLCLLRRHGPADLADEIAASLAAFDSLDGVVIIGADEVLDQALARHGLPRVGAHAGPPASARLLSLVVEAAFHPMDMGDLHALLAADPGPIPRSLAAKLVGAMRQWPGRRTGAWKDALAEGLSRTDEERREELERRVNELLLPVCGRDERLAVSALRSRLEILDAWARGRAPYVPSLFELSQRTRTLLEAVELLGSSTLSRHEVRRLCDDLGEPAWTWHPAQAGLVHVDRPGAILAPARFVVWWDFSRDAAPRPERLLLTRAERDGLRAVGVEPPDPALRMAIETAAWKRPLWQTEECLILACPRTDRSGDPNHPHPLWDDVTASLAEPGRGAKLELDRIVHPVRARTAEVPSRKLVTPAPLVTVGSSIALRDVESPSSVEKLLGCSLAWALDYPAWLRPGLSDGPPAPTSRLFGSLAHHILAQVLKRPTGAADEAAALAGEIFDEQCGDLCEDLLLAQHQADRATVRRAVVESARELAALASKHGARGVSTETPGATSAAGQTIKGRLDLVWDEPSVVLDLKWGKTTHAQTLESGTAVQLAAYAAMREAEGRPAETAYFALLSQELLAEPGGRLAAEARVKGSRRAAEIWSAAMAALARRRAELAEGRLEAPSAGGNEVDPSFSPFGLVIAPPCRYCNLAGICGREAAR